MRFLSAAVHCDDMSDFKDLKTWQKAHKMALETHRVACKIRGSGHSGVRKQMIDAALSVPTNIVESRDRSPIAKNAAICAWPLILPRSWSITC